MDEIKDEWIWWKHGVIYHIYLLSFYDSNDDGVGDLKGINFKLDYLEKLGIDAIWISPVFKSPMIDFGYDVSDYYSIDPLFGNISDFKELLSEAHKRNIKIILDMVLNHTSDQHPWFIESCADKKNPKRNWYIWKTSDKGRKPNNWKTAFGGSCWEYNKETQEYYLHSFLKEQPDLNWRNKEVQQEMFKMLSYWLDMGVDGFRFDVINFIIKDKKLRNNPFFYWLSSSRKIRTRNHPKSYKIIRNLRKLLDKYPDRMSVGEVYTLPPGNPKLAASYLSQEKNALHLTFDFSSFFIGWNARKYFRTIEKWQSSIPDRGWPTLVFSNHDLFRAINRIGIGRNQEKKARLLALLLLTNKGTPFIYYGEEIGMKNSNISRSKIQDPLGKKYWPFFKGRDRARTPMQWNGSLYAGFSDSKPWLPIDSDYKKINVEYQDSDPNSLLNLYIQLIRFRHSTPAIFGGKWIPACKGKNGIISYYRKDEKDQFLIILNFTSSQKYYFRKFNPGDQLVFSIIPDVNNRKFSDKLLLHPFEGIIIKLFENKD
jgi:alpha-glucosidase